LDIKSNKWPNYANAQTVDIYMDDIPLELYEEVIPHIKFDLDLDGLTAPRKVMFDAAPLKWKSDKPKGNRKKAKDV